MRFPRRVPSKSRQDVDHSDPGSKEFPLPTEHLKTICTGISTGFTSRIGRPTKTYGWKPTSTKPPVLASLILASLALGAIIEFLAQKSLKEGGLCLTQDADNASAGVILSRYGPTAIAVIYSLTWTWIDLDIRRIQPWLELSRADGGTADSTLLLDYPFEFLAFIPLKAWRKKHMLVFLGGSIMMLVFWAVTPLQSAIFGTQFVSVSEQVLSNDITQLGTLEQQLDALDDSILHIAYGITWLKQRFPAFTTSTYGLLPFQPMKSRTVVFPEGKWTTSATAMSTDLKCWPADVTPTDVRNEFDFDNGQGCKATLEPSTHGRFGNETGITYTLLYIGYHEDPQLDWFLQNPNCSTEASHQFLAIWMADGKDMTALFCEPSYWKQAVQVTISADDRRPVDNSLVPLGEPQVLSENDFNATAFEFLIGTGVSPKLMRREYPRDRRIEQYPTTSDFNLAYPITNMVGFAVGDMDYSIAQLKNSTVLQNVFSSAHKKLFSAAIPSLITSANVPESARTSTIRYTLYGVVVNRAIALAVEILLLIIALLVVAMLCMFHRTKSLLRSDPGSIGATLTVLGNSDALRREYASKDRHDDETLRKSVQTHRYKMVQTDTVSGKCLHLECLHSVEPVGPSQPGPNASSGIPVQPHALRPLSGFTFVITLLAGMVVLVYLKRQEEVLGGLPRPSEDFTILQLLENYVPTIFATLVEPFFVLLNRLLCLLQPFHDLRRGRQPAIKVFGTSYTSLPPQFSLWKSLKSGHVLLASLCLVSLLANVLAVALGALFNESPVTMAYNKTVTQTFTDTITPSAFVQSTSFLQSYDHFYVAAANLSSGAQLTPWTDAEFAYTPFGNPTTTTNSNNISTTRRARTKGFGVDVTCSALSTSADSVPYVQYSLADGGSQDIYAVFHTANGSLANCTTLRGLYPSGWLNTSTTPVQGPLAQELVTSLRPRPFYINNKQVDPDVGDVCDRKILLSWMRIDAANRNGSLRATHMYCVPTWRSATFDVTVDEDGYVLSSARVGDFDDMDTTTRNLTEVVLTKMNEVIGDGAADETTMMMMRQADDDGWHNDTLSRDWMNFLLKLKLNATRLLDASQPVPALDSVAPPVEQLYQTLVAHIIGSQFSSLFQFVIQPVDLQATQFVPETRIFMDEVAFIIAITILGFMVIVATSLYIRESKPFLPRLPSTIGSLLAYVAASQAVKEYSRREQEVRDGHSFVHNNSQATYSFGKYLGVDGLDHVGIELDPFVAPGDDGAHVRFRGWVRRFDRKKATDP